MVNDLKSSREGLPICVKLWVETQHNLIDRSYVHIFYIYNQNTSATEVIDSLHSYTQKSPESSRIEILGEKSETPLGMPQKVLILVLSHGIFSQYLGHPKWCLGFLFPSTVSTHGSFFHIQFIKSGCISLSSKLDFKAFLHLDPAWLLGKIFQNEKADWTGRSVLLLPLIVL